jgi:hypothetical protein
VAGQNNDVFTELIVIRKRTMEFVFCLFVCLFFVGAHMPLASSGIS